MLRGATASAFAMAGTAVFRIVVSSDSMKKATATSHGNKRLTDWPGAPEGVKVSLEWAGIMLVPACRISFYFGEQQREHFMVEFFHFLAYVRQRARAVGLSLVFAGD